MDPLAIIWEDGRVFGIDKVAERRYAASMKVGGHGLRYSVLIGGKPRFIWLDEHGWYVERIVRDGIVSLVEPGMGIAAPQAEEAAERPVVSCFVPIGLDEDGDAMRALKAHAKRTGIPIIESQQLGA